MSGAKKRPDADRRGRSRLSLLKRLAPAYPWVPWLPTGAMVAVIAWMMTNQPPDLPSRHLHLRSGLMVAALGLTFAFDDIAAEMSDASPSPLWLRRGMRALIGSLPWAILVIGLLWMASQPGNWDVGGYSEVQLVNTHVTRLLLEASTMAVWGLSIAALVASRWDQEPGRIASVSLLAVFAASWAIPRFWSPWDLPPGMRWEAIRIWWWGALGLALVLGLVWSWDTRYRAWVRHLRRRYGPPTSTHGAVTGTSFSVDAGDKLVFKVREKSAGE
jgi:hypothetical protein